MKFGSLIADIFHDAEVNAGNSVKVKHRGLVDFNALQGSTLNHGNIPKKIDLNVRSSNPALINACRTSLKVKRVDFLKLYGT